MNIQLYCPNLLLGLVHFLSHPFFFPTSCTRRECGTVPLVLDLRIAHDRFGSSSDPSINGQLHYPNDVDRSLNEATPDKIRKYRTDYNNNPPNVISFIPTIVSTSGRLHWW